jgi:hypothetical protein
MLQVTQPQGFHGGFDVNGRSGAVLAVAITLVGGIMVAVPARADTCPTPDAVCDTALTFEVTATDGLNVTVPNGPLALGTAASGATITNTFTGAGGSNVSVADQRSVANPTWTVTVTSTNFTTGGGSPAETITNANIGYRSGNEISPVNGPFTPGQPIPPGTYEAMTGTVTAFSRATAGGGNNSVSWDPGIQVTVPATAVAGTYTGSVTHSIS